MNTTINTDDAVLLDLCRSGKQQGYTVLYQKYAKMVFNSVYRLINDKAQSEDILQEVFVKAFTEIKSLKKAESFGGWIKRIAINQSLSCLRKNKIHFADVDEMQIADNEEKDMEEQQNMDFRVEELQKAIAELPATLRTIVNLFLFENMPQQDIAQILEIPHATVRSYYHRAKKKIFDQLKQKENERSA